MADDREKNNQLKKRVNTKWEISGQAVRFCPVMLLILTMTGESKNGAKDVGAYFLPNMNLTNNIQTVTLQIHVGA